MVERLPELQGEPQVEPIAKPELTIMIVGARGLRNSDWVPGLGKPDCYCVVKSANRTLFTTRATDNTLEPVWNESAKVNGYSECEPLQFSIHDSDVVGSECVGKTALESERFANGFNGELQLVEAGKGLTAFLRLKIEVAGLGAPPGPQPQFELSVEKGAHRVWGLDFDIDEEALRVSKVNPGPFTGYNDTVKPELQLISSDYIESVNGVTGPGSTMLDQFRTKTKLRLVVRREVLLTAILERRDAQAPLGVLFFSGSRSLLITEIIDGVFKEFNNDTQDDNMKIQVGDRIIAVGGFQGSGASIQNKLQKIRGKFQLVLSRRATSSHWSFGC